MQYSILVEVHRINIKPACGENNRFAGICGNGQPGRISPQCVSDTRRGVRRRGCRSLRRLRCGPWRGRVRPTLTPQQTTRIPALCSASTKAGVRLGRRQETYAGAAQGMQAGDDLFRGRKSAEAACEIGEQQPRQLREDVCGRANGFLIERAQREPLAVAAPAVEDRFDRLQLRPGTLEFDLHLLAGFQDGERFGKQRNRWCCLQCGQRGTEPQVSLPETRSMVSS